LSRIIISEFNETLFTKEVDQEKQEGYLLVYLRITLRIVAMIEEVNPNYPCSKTLASSITGENLHQNYLKDHFKTITNLSPIESIADFYTDIRKKMLQ
jgi:hypothetical protein